MKNPEEVKEWLRRAKSNLILAKAGRPSDEVLYEDVCFYCQQAVEKALKGLLVSIGIDFPYTHSISKLIGLIEVLNIDIPAEIKNSIVLTVYAMEARYPGYDEFISEEEYKETVRLAEQVYNWVRERLNEF
jgi:HEPN domain-containing protein